MLDTIVVAVDDLRRIDEMVNHVLTLAPPFSARVFVLGIIEQLSGGAEHFTDPVIWNMAKSEAQATLHQHVRRLEDQGIETALEIFETSTVETLLQYAEDIHSDLIMVAYNHETPAPMIRSILKHSKTPVFLTRTGEAKATYTNVLVPLDGSQRAESSLTLATAIAQQMDAKLHLAHVVQQPQIMRQNTPSADLSDLAQRLVEKNKYDAERYLDQISSRLPVEAQRHVLVDAKITKALHDLTTSESIDLLVLSAHGHSAEPEWPFGSIAENIVNYCKVPTILVQDLPAYFTRRQAEPTRVLQGSLH